MAKRAPETGHSMAGRGHGAILGLCAVLAAAYLVSPHPAEAQSCIVTTPIGPGNDVGTALAIQTDGKIVLVGYSSNGADDQFAVARYNTNFTLDPSFDFDGVVTTNISAGQDRAETVALQTDGKIVVAGHRNSGGGNDDFALVRYNTDGSLDTFFNVTGIVSTAITGVNDEIEGVAIQSDGKIVVAGWSQRATLDYVVARYNTNGSLDTAGFNAPTGYFISTNGATNDVATEAAIQPSDGKVVIGGWAGSGASDDFAAARFNTNGTLDGGFGGGTVLVNFLGFLDRANGLVIQPDGRIVLTGEVRDATTFSMFGTARLNSNGTLDTATFNPVQGRVTTDFFAGFHDTSYAMVFQSDLKIVVGGWANWDGIGTSVNMALARYNGDGSLDTASFNPGGGFGGPPNQAGKVTTPVGVGNDWIDALALQLDGKIVGGGYSRIGATDDLALVRYNPDGSVDTSCAAPVRYRSIGTAVNDIAGSVTATTGSAVVTGAGTFWQTNNRGRGDRITIDGLNYTILQVISNAELRLTSVFTGVTGSGKAYTIARNFTTFDAWEDCIDGPPGTACPFFPVASASLVADNRREVGIAYDDTLGVDFSLTADVIIDGSVTDATHTIALTADGGNRHNGAPGAGVIVSNNGPNEIIVQDSNVTIEWLELTGLAGGIDLAAVEVAGLGADLPQNVLLQNLLIHDFFDNVLTFDMSGIRLAGDTGKSVTIRNCMIWNGDENGIEADDAADSLTIENCSVDNMTDNTDAPARGFYSAATPNVVVKNSIATRCARDYDVAGGSFSPSSTNNISENAGAYGAPGANAVTGVVPSDIFAAPGSDLHLKLGANVAADSALDLSASFWNDIDGQSRLGLTWDRGADERGAPTAVELVSFTATGADGAVDLKWETASELKNLGFHIYRTDSEAGAYARITSEPIPGLGSSPVGARYRYRDSGLVNGATYFYKLEDIETTGTTTLHGPVSATPSAEAISPAPEVPSLITYGRPEANGFRVLERTPRGVVLELVTEGFYAEPQEDGSVRLEIPGFEPLAGSPSVPVLRPWVDALVGRGATITSVRESAVESFESLRPSGAEAADIVASRKGTVRARRGPARRYVETTRLVPGKSARLLQVGFQGDVKKAQMELAPLRWNGARGALVLARRLTVHVSFQGVVADRHRESAGHRAGDVLARLVTTEAGLNEVPYAALLRRGRGVETGALSLSRHGKPVAFHIEPEGARFAPGSKLYFLADDPKKNPYGHELVYELGLESGGVVMDLGSAPPAGEEISSYFETEDYEENRLYQAGLVDASDLWLWDVLLAPATKSFAFDVEELAPGSSRLTVWLQGVSDLASDPDHHIRVYVNDIFQDELLWNGKEPRTLEMVLPEGSLREGGNLLRIENAGDTGASYSMVMLDRFQVVHPRWALAEGGRLQGSFSQSGSALVSGLGASFLLDTTGEKPRWLSGAEVLPEGGLRFHAEAGRSYLAVSREAVSRPLLRFTAPARLKKDTLSADYLVIGPSAFSSDAAPLLAHRGRQGLKVKYASVEDIYGEFGLGESRPEAIREFLSYAYHHWREPKLRYVLLLGDATYDFKDYLQTGVVNQIPPLLVKTSFLWTASDPAFAAVHGEDILPDVAIGRLPAASALELREMVSKILAYEAGEAPLDGLLVLATDNSDRAGDFVANADEIAGGVLAERPIRRLHLHELSGSMRGEILKAFDEGASLVSYIGHGGIHLWADENVFNNSDVASLAPQPKQPLLLTMNCLNGYFHFPYFDSLAEELLKAEGRGAIAAFSPSGLSLDAPAHLFHKALLDEVFRHAHQRLGDAVLKAQGDYAATGAFPELLSIYHLLGDPALLLR